MYPALVKARERDDERAWSELAASLSMSLGLLTQACTDFYNHAIYQNLPDSLGRKIQPEAKHVTKQASKQRLLQLKAVSARFVAAGTVVAVAWDAWDAVGAFRDEDRRLAWAYVARGAAGAMTVVSIIAASRSLKVALWAARLNVWGLVLTLIFSAVIYYLKKPAWQTWLQRQPFCLNTPMQPHESEADMANKLIDALEELKG